MAWEDFFEQLADGQYDRMDTAEAELVMLRARPDRSEAEWFLERVTSAALSDVATIDLSAVLTALVRRGELVVVRPCELVTGGEVKAISDQRRLAREIEAKTRGRLTDGGRQYRLVAGDDLPRLSDRDSYEVVHRTDAIRILDEAAKQSGAGASGLPALLAQAREKLTRDWRPPLRPEGLVLLRRIVVVSSQRPEVGQAITPSALKKIRDEGWIEIAFVDAGMEPVADVDYEVRLADGQVKSGKTSQKGLARYDDIQPGECRVRFPKLKGPVVLV
jgi:hypothetical protein